MRAALIASALASRLASRRLAALVRFDGLYDVFSSDEAVDVVRKRLVENAGDPPGARCREPLFNSGRRSRVARKRDGRGGRAAVGGAGGNIVSNE